MLVRKPNVTFINNSVYEMLQSISFVFIPILWRYNFRLMYSHCLTKVR